MSDSSDKVPDKNLPTDDAAKKQQLGYNLTIKMASDFMWCRCSYAPKGQGSMITHAEFENAIKQKGVVEGIDREAFEKFVTLAAAGNRLNDVQIASGIPPVNGTDQYFTLLVSPTTTVNNDTNDFKASVDMYSVQQFINVNDGDVIGRIFLGEPGSPGRNVLGNPVPQVAGKKLKFSLGKHVSLEENGTLLIATATGRFSQARAEFSVDEQYIVKGNVDFKIGSINFKGFVEIHGDVMDNFAINATKGLTVTGNIGKCSISSSGDITFNGINGEGAGKVVCGGTLRARYLHDTDVECEGDVIVDIEIHNCNIKARGRIIVVKDTILGGSYTAMAGIDAKKLGSMSSKNTSLIAGVDYRSTEMLKEALENLFQTYEKIRGACSLEEVTELRAIATQLNEEINTIKTVIDPAANPKINVRSRLYENVRITLGRVTQTIAEQKDGPISVIENSTKNGFSFLPVTGLEVKAADSVSASKELNTDVVRATSDNSAKKAGKS